MNTERTRNAILDLISKIEMCREIQDQIDKVYDDFCDTIIGEMAETIPKCDWSNKGRKKLSFHKPYWNDELTDLWKNMRNKEKPYLKCESKDKDIKRVLRHDCKVAQNTLDKRIRFLKESTEPNYLSISSPQLCTLVTLTSSGTILSVWDQKEKTCFLTNVLKTEKYTLIPKL